MKRISRFLAFWLVLLVAPNIQAQEHSIAREFNEILLDAIRASSARPTVHARNLFHVSMGMYEAWAAYDDSHEQLFLGKTLGVYDCEFDGITLPDTYTIEEAREIAVAFAAYRLIQHRYQDINEFPTIQFFMNQLLIDLELNPSFLSVDYSSGSPEALGNYIAQEIINFGYTDQSNEINDYENQSYVASNDTLWMQLPGNPNLTDPNAWQPLGFTEFVGQGENADTLIGSPDFLSPEWGLVTPFSLSDEDAVSYFRDDWEYKVFHDPGAPVHLDTENPGDLEDEYKWNHTLVSVWSSHLDAENPVIIDVSPNSIGNIDYEDLPTTFDEYQDFYNLMNGGDASVGYEINPVTGLPYEPQYVPLGDYGRILAEFWADGPDSETPPGHWFTLLNFVNDQEELEKKWQGKGEPLSNLEWDVKTYITLGGTVHDAAICAWGIKGWYDYIRPVSSIRWMADNGQSTNPDLPSYDPNGIPLIPGKIELVSSIDPLAGEFGEHMGKVKLKAWKGPDYINNPNVDVAGVDWILAENWYPYQRSTFVTPPFAGYVSGHSTFSRAAAEVMTLMTGTPYFPGGMGEFEAPENQYLVFEDGPSMDITLQWATYQDASDQCSLSRIWGGIHPPIDDIPGRKIGYEVGHDAFNFANNLFDNKGPEVSEITVSDELINQENLSEQLIISIQFNELIDTTQTPSIFFPNDDPTINSLMLEEAFWADCDEYVLIYTVSDSEDSFSNISLEVGPLSDPIGNEGIVETFDEIFELDLKSPEIINWTASPNEISDSNSGISALNITVFFDEPMQTEDSPQLTFPDENPLDGTLTLNESASEWLDETSYIFSYDVVDVQSEMLSIDGLILNALDDSNNPLLGVTEINIFSIDMENPTVVVVENSSVISGNDSGIASFFIDVTFSENMATTGTPLINFTDADPLINSLSLNDDASEWIDDDSFRFYYDVMDADEEIFDIDIEILNGVDILGNDQVIWTAEDHFSIDSKNPEVMVLNANTYIINDQDIGSNNFSLLVIFNETMNEDVLPIFEMPEETSGILTLNEGASYWVNDHTYEVFFDVANEEVLLEDIDVLITSAEDIAGNLQYEINFEDYFSINTFTVGIKEIDSIFEDTKVYPNPVGQGQEFVVEFSSDVLQLVYEVYDSHGRLIENKEYHNQSIQKLILQTQNWSNGMYYIDVYQNQDKKTFKIIVQ